MEDFKLYITESDSPYLPIKLLRLRKLPVVSTYTIGDSDTLQTIAAQIYGDDKYSWVVSIYAGIPEIDDKYKGTTIPLPDINAVKDLLR